MSQLTTAVGQASDGGMLMGVMTIVFFAFFVGWVVWAWSPALRSQMDAASRMPLDDESGGVR
jgi:cbb3-type cytochrome oxidase subunit 3